MLLNAREGEHELELEYRALFKQNLLLHFFCILFRPILVSLIVQWMLFQFFYCVHMQSYEQAFEQIKEATGITDIDQLVTKFIEGVLLSSYMYMYTFICHTCTHLSAIHVHT